MEEGISGQEAGRRNAERLERYLAETPHLPVYRGAPNVRAVAEACGFSSTGVIYNNPACRELWEARLKNAGAAGILTQAHETRHEMEDDGEISQSSQLVDALRAEISAGRANEVKLMAEIRMLRERLTRLRHIEQRLLDHGRLPR